MGKSCFFRNLKIVHAKSRLILVYLKPLYHLFLTTTVLNVTAIVFLLTMGLSRMLFGFFTFDKGYRPWGIVIVLFDIYPLVSYAPGFFTVVLFFYIV